MVLSTSDTFVGRRYIHNESEWYRQVYMYNAAVVVRLVVVQVVVGVVGWLIRVVPDTSWW